MNDLAADSGGSASANRLATERSLNSPTAADDAPLDFSMKRRCEETRLHGGQKVKKCDQSPDPGYARTHQILRSRLSNNPPSHPYDYKSAFDTVPPGLSSSLKLMGQNGTPQPIPPYLAALLAAGPQPETQLSLNSTDLMSKPFRFFKAYNPTDPSSALQMPYLAGLPVFSSPSLLAPENLLSMPTPVSTNYVVNPSLAANALRSASVPSARGIGVNGRNGAQPGGRDLKGDPLTPSPPQQVTSSTLIPSLPPKSDYPSQLKLGSVKRDSSNSPTSTSDLSPANHSLKPTESDQSARERLVSDSGSAPNSDAELCSKGNSSGRGSGLGTNTPESDPQERSLSRASKAGLISRRRGRSLPEEQKDDAYWERRRKNNEAAKRSRDARRAKEDEIALRAALLEQENMKLRIEIAALKAELENLRQMLLTA